MLAFAPCHERKNAEYGYDAAGIGGPANMLVLFLVDLDRAYFGHVLLLREVDAGEYHHQDAGHDKYNA